MEKRIIFGHDLKQRALKSELQSRLSDDEFYMGYTPAKERLLIVRENSRIIVSRYPEKFWQQAKQRHPVTKTIQ